MKPKGIIVYNNETREILYHAKDLKDLIDIVGDKWYPLCDEVLINIEGLYRPDIEKPPAD